MRELNFAFEAITVGAETTSFGSLKYYLGKGDLQGNVVPAHM